jgi:hypothetical protein
MSAGDGIPVANAPVDEHAAMRLWEDYRAARPDRALDAEPPSVEVFGDHPALTDELLGLVLDGTKRATASTVAEFRFEGQPLPRVGSHWIACPSHKKAQKAHTELRNLTCSLETDLGHKKAQKAHTELRNLTCSLETDLATKRHKRHILNCET